MQHSQQTECYKLNNGEFLPKIGLGTSASENLKNAIKEAYYIGYRHFDTAQKYGNEKIVGEALSELFKEGVQRKDLFITTKVFPFKENNIIEKLKQSLKDLQIEYIDLVAQPKLADNNELIITHKPLHISWKEMEVILSKLLNIIKECVKLKLAKSIGVSNFNVQSLMNILSFCEIKPQVNQVEMHPYLNQNSLHNFCNRMHIHITAFSPLARYNIGRQIGEKANLLEDQVIKTIALKYQKSPAQIALCYLLQKGSSFIPKTDKKERLKENFNIWDILLTEQEMEELGKLNKNLRTVDTKWLDSYYHIALFS